MPNEYELPEFDGFYLEDLLPEVAASLEFELIEELEEHFLDEDFSSWREALRQKNIREYLELDESERDFY